MLQALLALGRGKGGHPEPDVGEGGTVAVSQVRLSMKKTIESIVLFSRWMGGICLTPSDGGGKRLKMEAPSPRSVLSERHRGVCFDLRMGFHISVFHDE